MVLRRRDKMGRLIDADDLIGVIQYNTNYKPNKSAIMADELIRYINRQPVAYDVDKVVERLETSLETNTYYSKLYDLGIKHAIAIVKGAAKDE
jgi:hypothetical protein